MADLPASVGYMTVTGRLVLGYADSNDAGSRPDMAPGVGTVTFAPDIKTSFPLVSIPDELMIAAASVKCALDANGNIVPPADGLEGAPDSGATPGVVLVAPLQPGILSDTDWTWTATFTPAAGQKWKAFSRTFTGAPGDVKNIASIIPVPANPGTDLILWQAAVDTTEAAATRAEVAAASVGDFAAKPAPAVQGLRFALDNNLNAGFGWHGDSTGDSTGADPSDLRTPTRLAELIGAAYPNYHVLSRHWNTATETFDQPVVLQSAPQGQAYTQFNGRSARFTPSLFTTGNMDLRAKVSIPNTATGADQILAAQVARDGTPWATAFVFRWAVTGTGSALLAISYDGGGWDNFVSTAALPAAYTGWLRATLQITPGASGNITVRFYTSTDGATWTLLGSAASYDGPRSALFATTASDFEIGGYAWQPASDTLHGKMYEVEIRDGIDGPLLAPALPHLWERFADPTTTYGGAPTLYLLNASASGTGLTYHRDPARLKKMTPNYGQVVTYFNDSHNEAGASGAITWLPPYKAWVDAVQARLPLSAAIAVGQNPHTAAWPNESQYGISHVFRISELATYSGRQGWGFLDLFGAFTEAGVGTLIGGDGLHPTQAGYALAADVAFGQLGSIL